MKRALRRLLAVLAVTAVLAPLSVATTSSPAEATIITSAAGCGTDLAVGLDAAALLLPGTSKTYTDVSFACVVNLQPINLGPFMLPFGGAVAAAGKLTITIANTGSLFSPKLDLQIPKGYLDGCIPFAFGININSENPATAQFTCLALHLDIVNGNSVQQGLFPSFSSPYFTMVAGVNGSRGTVNGLAPFNGLSGLFGSLLNPLLLPSIQKLFPGPLTDPVQVNLASPTLF